MDIFQAFLAVSLVVGLLMLLLSFVGFRLAAKDNSGEKLSAIDASVAEADEAIDELNGISQAVFKQMDDKYKELLFIYNLIDERKAELLSIGGAGKPELKPSGGKSFVYDKSVDDAILPAFKSPKFKQVIELKNKGLAIADIAKKLNIGKGEVQLILDLGKVR